MTKIYPLFHPYGNYLDNYYVPDYEAFITYLLNNFAKDSQDVNLGITDGVTIINVLQGDYSGYNLCIVEKEDGQQDIYKITKKEFVRKGIWRVSMVLDVFSKYYENVKDSSVLVNRLGFREWDKFDPILFNNEDLELSEVKQEQKYLRIVSGLNMSFNSKYWIGGYLMFIQKGALGQGLTASVNVEGIKNYDYSVEGIENFVLYNKKLRVDYDYQIEAEVFYKWNGTGRSSILYNLYRTNVEGNMGEQTTTFTRIGNLYSPTRTRKSFSSRGLWYYPDGSYGKMDLPDTSEETFINIYENYITNNLIQPLRYKDYSNYNERYVLDTETNIIYQINFAEISTNRTYPLIPDEISTNAIGRVLYSYGEAGITCDLKETIYVVQLLQTTVSASKDFEISVRRETTDEGYAILYFPVVGSLINFYPLVSYRENRGIVYPQIVKAVIDALVEKYGGENGVILDVQETYFIPNMTDGGIGIVPIDAEEGEEGGAIGLASTLPEDIAQSIMFDINPDGDGKGNYQVYIYALENANIEQGILLQDNAINVEDFKLEQMNKYILRSPSGASTYEFSLARNGGLKGFNFNASLRPYGSMYQIQPIYENYYGETFKDIRGLVMLEDTSITQQTDLYEQYKRQNLNYINSFESNLAYERSSLQVSQDLEKTNFLYDSSKRVINSTLDTIGDVVSLGTIGQAYGFNASNMQGATLGAGLGGTAIGEAIEYGQLLANQKAERKQLELSQTEAKRQWKYNLANMKALPLNTEKVSGIYNTNAKQFILEKYTPTNYEIELYNKYLELYGISVGAVINLQEYEFDYIEGEVVLYNGEITNEEYEELQLELNSGRREYTYEPSDEETE